MNAVAAHIGEITNRDLFFVRNMVKRSEAKFSDKFDIYDPIMREPIAEVREPDIGGLTKAARFFGKQSYPFFVPITGVGADADAPFNYVVSIPNGPKVLRIVRTKPFVSFGLEPVEFFDESDNLLARMKRVTFSCFGYKYRVNAPAGESMFVLHLKSRLNRFDLFVNQKEVGSVATSWKGVGAELFKEDFKFAISIASDVPQESLMRTLIFGAGICLWRIKR